MKKIFLFATTPKDAMDWAEANGHEFDDISWFRGPAYMQDPTIFSDSEGVEYEIEYHATLKFEDTEAYVEAREYLK